MEKDIYTADFETRTIAPTKVWAWGVSKQNDPNFFIHGNSIDTFITFLYNLKQDTTKIYFHNLKFDGVFIIDYLLKHNWQWKASKKLCGENDFTTVISGDGKFYLIDLYFRTHGKVKKHVSIQDSLKLLNMSVAKVAKSFNLEQQKGEIDYTAHDTEDFDITDDELSYLQNDVQIMANGLSHFFKLAPEKMTIGSCALTDYKEHIGKNHFKKLFPQLKPSTDALIRKSYKGGFTAVNESRTNELIHNGQVYDVNSLYPSVMYYQPLPIGKPVRFEGEYTPNNKYTLYVQEIVCSFKIKKNKIPIIQLKHTIGYTGTEYLKESNGEVNLVVTSVDLELIKEHYNIEIYEYKGGYMFMSSTELFKSWIDKWFAIKEQATRDGNVGLRTIAKLFLNSLYGKFGTNPKVTSKYPIIDNNKVKLKKITYPCYDDNGNVLSIYKDENGLPLVYDGETIYNEDGTIKDEVLQTDINEKESVYIPLACFVTAWARDKTIRTAQKIHEDSLKKNKKSRWLYCDTDSIHVEGFEPIEGIDIHDTKLGYWAHESDFKKAKFLQAKRYIEDIYNGLPSIDGKEYSSNVKVTCAGLQSKFHSEVTFDNFNYDSTFSKIVPKIVEGGVILERTEFTLKPNCIIHKNKLNKKTLDKKH